jgi:hypothetical protein
LRLSQQQGRSCLQPIQQIDLKKTNELQRNPTTLKELLALALGRGSRMGTWMKEFPLVPHLGLQLSLK